jgi:murein L,D-transpeptidase YcbB/YkuD
MRPVFLMCIAGALAAFVSPASARSVSAVGPAPVEAPADTVVEQTLRMITETANHPYLTWPDFPHYQDEMEAIYGPGEFELLWFDEDRPTRQARQVIEALSDADVHGLDPLDYDAGRLAELLASIGRGESPDGSQLALIDAAISVGFLRYLSDLHIGRVNPENLHFGFNIEEKKLDLAATVNAALERDAIAETVARIEPGFPQYARMREILADYRELALLDLPRVPEVDVVHPGDEYAGTAELRTLLIALGDLSAGTTAAGMTYDSVLAAGVEHFQARHGLEVDGIIGKGTFTELNTPLTDRVHQIELALERLRWLPDVTSEPIIVVNIPAFELWALDPTHPDHRIALEMRVVVGKAVNKQTPAFRGDMRYVIMSPYWNVPYSIAVNEMLPRIANEPDYLETRNLELVREFSWDAEVLPPTDENIAAIRTGRVNIRQQPGPGNSLGSAKFIFPNSENVYLHDTPAHQLFERTRRDFSHGCIRVEDPQALAEWVLRDQGQWTAGAIEEARHAHAPSRADLTGPLPVILFYTTVMADEDRPHFYDDIYGHDAALAAALEVGYPYPP